MLTGSKDNKIKMFDIRNIKNEVREFESHESTV